MTMEDITHTEQEMQSASVKNIVTALCKAVTEIPEIKKSKTARVHSSKGSGSSYEYAYADLSDVLAAVVPSLAKHGMMLSWSTRQSGDKVTLTGFLRHGASEEFFSASLPMPILYAQEMGSMLSYLKRYIVGILLPVAATEPDDDGARATHGVEDEDAAKKAMQEAREALAKRPDVKKVAVVDPATRQPATPDRAAELTAQAKVETAEAKAEVAAPAAKIPLHQQKLRAKMEAEGISEERFMVVVTHPKSAGGMGWKPVGTKFTDLDDEFVTKLLDPNKRNWANMVKALPTEKAVTEPDTSFNYGANV